MRLLIVGFGTVGQGLAELLVDKKELLKREYGLEYEVIGIADTLKGNIINPDGIDLEKALDMVKRDLSLSKAGGNAFEGDALGMINLTDADVFVEATYTDIKTAEPAASYIRAALENGMHVATSNKGPIALFYQELQKVAEKNDRLLLFEGTVMSGTPVLNLIRETLAGSSIQEIRGILNGTTNYILTRMEEGLSYEESLKKAQEFGYAEAVPDADVLGWDALAKVTILARVIFGAKARPFDYPCEGITGITAGAITEAREKGNRFKLIGRIWKDRNLVKASVTLEEIEVFHPLGGVMGATNALTITTDTLGEVTIIGPGAGKKETGYSLLTDLIKIGRGRSQKGHPFP